jgi:hypothetical protein
MIHGRALWSLLNQENPRSVFLWMTWWAAADSHQSLDNYITDSRAVSGAAILGAGRVALIIDVFGRMEELS